MTATQTDAPLTNYSVIGIQENRIGINAGTPEARQVPGGSCWHCGTGIAIEVVIRSTETGETHTIGTTCAERVGLDGPELKAMLAERYAEERYQRSAAVRRSLQNEAAARDAKVTAEHGDHGTPTRYAFGCNCADCRLVAPHATYDRFFEARCRCLRCIEWVLSAHEGFAIYQRDVIVDVETGEVVPAKTVNTRYGTRWCVRDGMAWLPFRPARRDTLAKKGYVEAEVPMLVQSGGRGSAAWSKNVCRLADPIADRWGEPIRRSDVA